MATLDQLSAALIKADAAGNVDDARAFAGEIRKMRSMSADGQATQGAPVEAAAPVDPPRQTLLDRFKSGLELIGRTKNDIGYGAARGVKDVIDTGAWGLAKGYDLLTGQQQGEAARVQAMNEAGKAEYEAGYGDNTAASMGRMTGNIVATAPIGGIMGKGVMMMGSKLAPNIAPRLATALSTGGMSTGAPAAKALSVEGLKNAAIRIGGGAVSGGAMAGLIDPDDAGTGAMIGGALPVVGKVAGKVGGVVRKTFTATPEVAQLAQKAKALGIDIPADRLTNSKMLDATAASLNYVPFSGRIATETRMNNQIKKALSNTFGENTEHLSKDLIAKTQTKLGKGFDAFLTQNTVKVDQQLSDDLAKNLAKAKNELSADNYRIIENQVKDLWNKIDNGVIDGNAAYNVKKTLDRLGRGTGNEAFHAKQVRDTLMSSVSRSVGPEKSAAFDELKRKYANLKSLEKLAGNSAEGDISMARLGNISSRNKEVQDLSQIAATFAKGRESPHGAMQRVTIGGGVTALGGGLAAGVAAPVAIGLTGGRLTNMALNSNKLKNMILAQPNGTNKLADLLANPAVRAAPIAAQSR
jgi:hypothetical protein